MNSNKNKIDLFISQLFIPFLKIYCLNLLFFSLYRIFFFWTYGNGANIKNHAFEILNAFFIGLRFDLSVTSYGMSFPFLLICSTLLVPTKFSNYIPIIKRISFYFYILIFTVFVFISFIDFYFYKFFQFRINILIFGIINDDTKSVLKSIWTDYPIIQIFSFMAILLTIYIVLIKRFFRENNSLISISKVLFVSSIIPFYLLYFLSMRGTLSLFPLSTENGIISENTFINNLTGNGVFYLKNALVEKNKQKINTDIKQKLKENGFPSAQVAVSEYLNRQVIDSDSLFRSLISKTENNEFLKQNPPNVVFIQMESFGSYYLDLHSSSLNVLGHLEDQLKNCILFRNFLSGTSGTIHSLEGLMVGTPLTPISQSIYLDRHLSSSVALPYKNAGYETNFITSAEMGWRNLDKFVPNQYYDKAEGCEFLLKNIPNSSRNEWGTYDEFLFQRMFDILKTSKKPQFIFGLTTTNHTPFSLPESYKPYPVNIPDSLNRKLRTDQKIAQNNFTNYQYSNDCLGRFIEMVRESPLGENTIIAASGDHNTLQLFSFYDKQLLDKYSVPLILYVPEKYLPKSKINTKVFGSHKDIFPTLFHLSLSEASYLQTGVNLLDEKNKDNFGIINFDVALNDAGCISILKPEYFNWTDDTKKYLQPTNLDESPLLQKLLLHARAYNASMTYFIQNDLKNSSGGK